jgi:3-deoxy-7-phosphoheptulonate synthase
MRAQIASGIADLHSPWDWNLGHVRNPDIKAKYQQITDSISDSLRFMRTVGADTAVQLGSIDLYTSHEGLLLDYEQCLTRQVSSTTATDAVSEGWYNTSAHFIWIGDRTRQLNGAHVEYFRGLQNPIGVKVGPTMKNDELLELLNILNPNKEIGKITLITRYGESKISECLPGHLQAVQKSGHVVVWQCDPMHG